MTLLWGIDLGGTKIEGVLLDNQYKAIVRERIPTESAQGYDHIVARIQEMIQILSSLSGESPTVIGIGTPGISDPRTKLMKNCNTTSLIGKPFHADLEAKLRCKIIIENDANCFALAENLLGAGVGARSLFGVILGTGVGGGIIINNSIVSGADGIAGEWGHTILYHDGPRCYCGKRGCVETFISGPALESWYASLAGTRRSLSEISNRAQSGADEVAVATIRRLTTLFGRSLATVINILDPEVIVLGGGVSNIDRLYSDGIEGVRSSIFNNSLHTKILKNRLGDSAGVFGAALLCER